MGRIGITEPVVISSFPVVDGVFPSSIADCDAWVLTCSRFDASGATEWVTQLREFTSRIVDSGRRVCGICFGHQLIALALGGTLRRRTRWVVGVQRLVVSPNKWIPLAEMRLPGLHQDEIATLPVNALTIASTADVKAAAYSVPPNVLCLQYHVEFTPAYFRALVTSRSHLLGDVSPHDVVCEDTDDAMVADHLVAFLIDAKRQPCSDISQKSEETRPKRRK